MLDWFYENWGSSGTLVLYIVIFVFVFPVVQFIEDKLPNLHGRTRKVCAIVGLVLSTATVIVVVNEGAFKYDYARRKFGDDFVQNATWSEIRDKLDENAVWKRDDKTDVDKEFNNILFDWADSTNLNITTVETDYRKNGTGLEVNRDVDFRHGRSGSDNK